MTSDDSSEQLRGVRCGRWCGLVVVAMMHDMRSYYFVVGVGVRSHRIVPGAAPARTAQHLENKKGGWLAKVCVARTVHSY